MSAPTFRYRNTVSGKIAELTELGASVFADVLEKVGPEAKPFEPGLFDSGTIQERAERRSGPDVLDVTTVATPTTKVEESEKIEPEGSPDGDADAAPAKSTTKGK